MTPPVQERGAALLTVLLLVAVMATVSATALDRIAVATRLTANAAVAAQGRHWLGMAEQLAAARLEDLLAADPAQTVAGPWLGAPRTIALPDGGQIRARVRDGGNCFNLNGLVRRDSTGERAVEPRSVAQLAALLGLLGIDAGRAQGIATAAAERIARTAAMADPSELRAVPGMTPESYAVVRPWICALPLHEPSALNVNTLLPEQAPLLAMLAPGQLSVGQARARLAERPASGFGSVVDFWKGGAFTGLAPPSEAAAQARVRSEWFVLEAEVIGGGREFGGMALIDARKERARIVRRSYGSVG